MRASSWIVFTGSFSWIVFNGEIYNFRELRAGPRDQVDAGGL